METLKFGLMLTIIPFTLIFLVFTIAWALSDMSLRKLSKGKRVAWSMVIILLPPFGSLLYNSKVRVPDIVKNYKTSLAS